VIAFDVESSGPVAVVDVRGTLDLATVGKVRTTLYKTLAEHPTAIVVDLTAVVVGDDITLTVFSAFARAAAGWNGCPVLLSTPDQTVADRLNRLAVTRLAPLHSSRAEAVAAAQDTPAPARLRTPLPPTVEALPTARRIIRDACHAWNLPHLIDDAELIITEIVANAVQHAGGPVDILLTRRNRHLHMSVRDRSHEPPLRSIPDPESLLGGRGLLLLDAIAAGWGTAETAEGKAVWATLRIVA
jgi:anti-anti-sigma regulatory factor/anti-sigma regulatory factor (Ser/Thr protein kinase)